MRKIVLIVTLFLLSLASFAQRRGGFLVVDETYLILNKTNLKIESFNSDVTNLILDKVRKDGRIRVKRITATFKEGSPFYCLYFTHADYFVLDTILKEINSATRVKQKQ